MLLIARGITDAECGKSNDRLTDIYNSADIKLASDGRQVNNSRHTADRHQSTGDDQVYAECEKQRPHHIAVRLLIADEIINQYESINQQIYEIPQYRPKNVISVRNMVYQGNDIERDTDADSSDIVIL